MTVTASNKLKSEVFNQGTPDEQWQSILDIGYEKWQARDEVSEKWSYNDMVDWVGENFGEFAKMAILLGKYNQQVTNGGHVQYFDNGYAPYDGEGCFNRYDNIGLHENMVELMKKFGLDTKTELSSKVFDIASRMELEIDDEPYIEDTCYECYGSGEVEEYNDDCSEYEYVSCPNCGGSGLDEISNENYDEPSDYCKNKWDDLDNEYYEISDKWEIEFEQIVREYLKG